MSNPEIEKAILQELYSAYFRKENPPNIDTLREKGGWEKVKFDNEVGRLLETGLITLWSMGGAYVITTRGILQAEDAGIVDEGVNRRNQLIRERVLSILADVYEKQGEMARVSWNDIASEEHIDISDLMLNIRILEESFLIQGVTTDTVKITVRGFERFERWKKQKQLKEALITIFEKLEQMEPHARGIALQKFLATLIGQQGWLVEEGVKTSNEEMDVIASQKREFYLLESKWEKDPIEAGVIRELRGKLDNRVDVRGIAVSMSGFSDGAVVQVKEYIGQRVILVFGPEDVNKLVHGEVTFEELLNTKYRELAIRKNVIFE